MGERLQLVDKINYDFSKWKSVSEHALETLIRSLIDEYTSTFFTESLNVLDILTRKHECALHHWFLKILNTIFTRSICC